MRLKKLSTAMFIAVESVLYAAFLCADLTGSYDTGILIKYASIVLCALFAVISAAQPMIAVAMGFTLLADTFLLLLDKNTAGLISFAAVQTVYLIVIQNINAARQTSFRKPPILLIIRVAARMMAAYVIYAAAAGPAMGEGLFTAVTCFYAVSFIDNIAYLTAGLFANRQKTAYPHPVMLLAGLVLFALCDINVAFFNTSAFVEVDSPLLLRLIGASDYLMWAFYLPGQVLIVLSGVAFDFFSKTEKTS